MKSFALFRSVSVRSKCHEVTGPLQACSFQPDFAPEDHKAKPKKIPFYDPYGPRPPPSDKIIQLAEQILALPPEDCRQICPTFIDRLGNPKMQSITGEDVEVGLGAQGGSDVKKKEKTAFNVKLEKFAAASKNRVIKVLCGFTCLWLNLKDANDLVEKVPSLLKQGVTGPLQACSFQPDFAPEDHKAKPNKTPFYDPYGPRPPPSDKIIQLAEQILALPPEEHRQIGPNQRN